MRSSAARLALLAAAALAATACGPRQVPEVKEPAAAAPGAAPAPSPAPAPAPAPAPSPAPSPAPAAPGKQPARITVDHILVGVAHPRLPGVARTREQARELAYEILEKVRKDPSLWAELKKKHSEDPPTPGAPKGGPYMLANDGVAPDPFESPRRGMVKGFGDAAFVLGVGEFGMADHDPVASPFGFHVLKRTR